MDENLSCRAYIAAVSRWMWGGRPEARVFANHVPVAVWCWTPAGTLVYREPGYVDSWSNACPVIDTQLMLHDRHYVLLKDVPSNCISREGALGHCRAGGSRSRTRGCLVLVALKPQMPSQVVVTRMRLSQES